MNASSKFPLIFLLQLLVVWPQAVCAGDGTIQQILLGGLGQSTVASGFVNPTALAANSSSVFVLDAGAGKIEQIFLGGLGQSTVASGFVNPTALAANSSSVFVLDAGAGKIEQILLGGLGQSTVASGFVNPTALAANSSSVFVLDAGAGKIEQIFLGGLGQSTVASGFVNPTALAANSSSVFVLDAGAGKIEQILLGGLGQSTVASGFVNPTALAANSSSVFVLDAGAGKIEQILLGGLGQSTVASGFVNPTALAANNSSVFVLDAPISSTISLSGASNATIITGGTGSLGVTVANSAAPGANNLNYGLSAAVQSGSATLGNVAPGSGSLAPGTSAVNTVGATSTNVGLNAIRFTASDFEASNSPQTADTVLTVLDHAAGAFVGGGTVLNLDFGTIPVGSGTHSLQFQIRNMPAAYRAGLDLDAIVEVSDPAGVFSTNAAAFHNLAPDLTSSLFDIFVEAFSVGHLDGEYRFDLSDQDGLSGSIGGQTLTLNVTANVVPEPSTIALLGIGAISLLACAWRWRNGAK